MNLYPFSMQYTHDCWPGTLIQLRNYTIEKETPVTPVVHYLHFTHRKGRVNHRKGLFVPFCEFYSHRWTSDYYVWF